ncbi:hypothetical protein [Hyalangium minutum]|uniref:Porin n=1 Tax=Hyalangium minutum TaxID=394096 RepID=A0A085WG74_9BACT|nr:hypothetical protein [Hyalangium minutum]KFE66687.1 hypothetical protein DB31_8901 [Hyalangium minutum]
MMGGIRKLLMACVLCTSSAALADQVLDSSLRLVAEGRYDDDLRVANEGGGPLVSKLSPRLGLELKDPTSKGEVFYAADFLMRQGIAGATLDHRAGLDLNHALSRRLQLEFTSRFFRVTDPTSLPREGVARTLAPTLYGQARLSATARATQRWDVRASYNIEGARVFEATGTRQGFVHSPSVEGWYRSTRRLSLGVEYRYQGFYTQEDFSQAHGAFAGLRYRLTRVTNASVRAGPIRYVSPQGEVGWLPRAVVAVDRDGELFDMGISLGHDLVGASGFENALWADFASVALARRINHQFSVNAVASYFRNGRAPNEDAFRLSGSPYLSQGYAVELGAEYRINRYLALQGTVNRIAQVGVEDEVGGVDLARNVLAVRLVISAW